MGNNSKFGIAGMLAAASLAMAGSAGAVAIGFGDGVNATWDNLGGAGAGDEFASVISLTNTANFHNMTAHFNPLASTDNDGASWATDFQFTINNGYKNIDTLAANTFFKDVTTGQTWIASFFNQGQKGVAVQFTAPTGTEIHAGDLYSMRIGLLTPYIFNNPSHAPSGTAANQLKQVKGVYSWSANWENTVSVPEPATWALMLGGFGMSGAALRRRRVAFAAA